MAGLESSMSDGPREQYEKADEWAHAAEKKFDRKNAEFEESTDIHERFGKFDAMYQSRETLQRALLKLALLERAAHTEADEMDKVLGEKESAVTQAQEALTAAVQDLADYRETLK